MTEDPPRLKDTLAEDLRDLLRDGADVPAMTGEDRALILAGVASAVASATPSIAPGVARSSGLLAAKAPFAIAALAAIVGVVVAGALFVRARQDVTRAPSAPTVAPTSPRSAIPTTPPDRAPPEAVVAPSSSSSPTASAVTSPVAPKAAPSSPPTSVSNADTLADESGLVGKARTTIDANPAAALLLLDEHARKFPRGQLAAERDFLRINALRRLGRNDDARQRARGYGARYPSSPYVVGVRQILDELGGP